MTMHDGKRLASPWEQGRDYGYGSGYAAGKEKAHQEIRAVAEGRTGMHAVDCGCMPCETLRLALDAILGDKVNGHRHNVRFLERRKVRLMNADVAP